MGTSYHVKWDHRGVKVSAESVTEDTQKVLLNVNQLMSTYLDNSELSQFNQGPPNQWVQLSADTMSVLEIAAKISEQSGGAFDITVGELVNLWGFGPDFKPIKIPDDEQINQALKSVGHHYLLLDDRAGKIQKQKPVYVDLSAIAKGYAVDRVARYLRSVGVSAFLVEVGGELRSYGTKPDGSPWRVAIELPVAGNPVAGAPVGASKIHRVLELNNAGLATSGDYRNFYEEGGVRYSHTIDPRSGRPISHRLASVTVLHEQAAYADGWATALMVLGEGQGYELAVQYGLSALFIVKDDGEFRELVTPEFRRSVRRGAE